MLEEEAGELKVTLYKAGTIIFGLFCIFTLFFLSFSFFVDLDEVGKQILLFATVFFGLSTLISSFFISDGCYLHEKGLKYVHWRRKHIILYKDMETVSVGKKLTLKSFSMNRISVGEKTVPIIHFKDGTSQKLPFELRVSQFRDLLKLAYGIPMEEVFPGLYRKIEN